MTDAQVIGIIDSHSVPRDTLKNIVCKVLVSNDETAAFRLAELKNSIVVIREATAEEVKEFDPQLQLSEEA